MDLIVKGGLVASVAGVTRADVGIRDGRIAEVGSDLRAEAARTIDASGCYVLPGGVDVHTHLDTPSFGTRTADDYLTGTIAAACGGTTTIVDFCQQEKGQSLRDAIATWHAKAADKAAIDYGFHIIIVDLNDAAQAELATLPEMGVTSFKLFMAYRGMSQVDDLALLRTMEQARAAGAVVMVHAENGDAAYFLQRKLVAEGKLAPKYHADSRPPRVEAEATARAIALAEITGAPLYVVHLTCEEALEELVRGRMRGAPVTGETCTQYLYLTRDDLDRPGFEGAKYVFTPPARTRKDQDILWRALADGTLAALSSDHSPWNYSGQKDMGRDDFTRIPNGGPGIEERMMMAWQGVAQGRLSVERFVEITATNPARLFGLFPRKGTIAPGADADLLIWDPAAKLRLTRTALHQNVDYTLYEGRDVEGVPRTVLLRGEVIVQDREYVGRRGSGRFLHRARWGERLPPEA